MHTLSQRPKAQRRALRLLLVPLFWLLLTNSNAWADDFCALTLNIIDANGLPIRTTWIEMVDQSGNVELRKEAEGPAVKICDFNFGPHTLRVGTNECLPVAISNLQVIIGSPLHLNVVINSCGYQDTMRTACFLYLRAVDEDGRPVPGAEIPLRAIPGILPKTDSYGRYQSLFRGSQDLILTREGFEPGKAHAQCRDKEQIDIKVVMLRKR